jgi:hypothetical protein
MGREAKGDILFNGERERSEGRLGQIADVLGSI